MTKALPAAKRKGRVNTKAQVPRNEHVEATIHEDRTGEREEDEGSEEVIGIAPQARAVKKSKEVGANIGTGKSREAETNAEEALTSLADGSEGDVDEDSNGEAEKPKDSEATKVAANKGKGRGKPVLAPRAASPAPEIDMQAEEEEQDVTAIQAKSRTTRAKARGPKSSTQGPPTSSPVPDTIIPVEEVAVVQGSGRTTRTGSRSSKVAGRGPQTSSPPLEMTVAEEEPPEIHEESAPVLPGLQFDEPLSWRAGRSIPVADLLRRLQSLSKEMRDMEQEENERESFTKVARELVNANLLGHKDKGVKAWTAACLVDILRLCAPDAPYTGQQLRVRRRALDGRGRLE